MAQASIPHTIYCKLLEVEKFCSSRNELYFIINHSRLFHGSLVWPYHIAQGHCDYFTGTKDDKTEYIVIPL